MKTVLYLLDDGNESQGFVVHALPTSEEEEPRMRRDSQVEEQLRHTQDKLLLKEKEVRWRYQSVLHHIHKLNVLSESLFHKIGY